MTARAKARTVGRRVKKAGSVGIGTVSAAAAGRNVGFVGVLIVMLALVVLYVLLTKTKALTQLMGDLTKWIQRFADPTQSLI